MKFREFELFIFLNVLQSRTGCSKYFFCSTIIAGANRDITKQIPRKFKKSHELSDFQLFFRQKRFLFLFFTMTSNMLKFLRKF